MVNCDIEKLKKSNTRDELLCAQSGIERDIRRIKDEISFLSGKLKTQEKYLSIVKSLK